jgi:hypothetical protein
MTRPVPAIIPIAHIPHPVLIVVASSELLRPHIHLLLLVALGRRLLEVGGPLRMGAKFALGPLWTEASKVVET